MGVFDGTVYRIRVRKGADETERWTSNDGEARAFAESARISGADAVQASEVAFVDNGQDRLDLSFGDFHDEEEEEES